MALEIPQEDIEALYVFSLYPVEKKDAIYSILKKIKLGDTPKKLALIISEQVDIDYHEVFSWITVYFTLIRTVDDSQKSGEEIIEELNNNILEHEFDFSPEDVQMIETSFLSFMELKSSIPIITSLAFNQIQENNNLYLNSTIVQDLRPVFYKDKIETVAFYNTIRIHFEKDDKTHQNIFLTMDLEDIDDLTEQLKKARLRIESIKEKFGDLILQL